MTSMTGTPASVSTATNTVIAGVDTHGETHHAAVLDELGRELADHEFPAAPSGYAAMLSWLRGHGHLERIGVEGTGTYGAGLQRYLRENAVAVVEVDRPDRRARRARGKSDPLDAYAAARAALNGQASATPKTRDGRVEAIRALRVARSGAVKARTQAINQLKALLVSAPSDLREPLRRLCTSILVDTCARLRPRRELDDPREATKLALRRLARRCQRLTEEITDADRDLQGLVAVAAPELLELTGVGAEVAGQMLVTAGDNPDRLRCEAAFAHLCGVAPVPASSGRTRRHRLNRGGDRAANKALYIVVLGRLRHDPRTRAYVERRTAQGLSKLEIIRCLKRYVAREIYNVLRRPARTHTDQPAAA